MQDKLNDRQKLFCKYYAQFDSKSKDNARKSYINAGYTANDKGQSAWDLLQEPKIKQEIDRIYQENCSILEITPAWIKGQAYLMYERCKDKNDVISARAFLELAGKTVGAFSGDRLDINVKAQALPASSEERRQWLEQELALLDTQATAGTGLPVRSVALPEPGQGQGQGIDTDQSVRTDRSVLMPAITPAGGGGDNK